MATSQSVSADSVREAYILKAGYLNKTGDLVASVKRRFFVLRSNLEMAYFNSDSPCGAGVDQIGIIKLREATGVSSESELGFVIDTPGRQWRLEAESAQEQQAWITLVSQIVTKQHPLTKHTFSVRKCGWLTKRGQIVENFKRRYVLVGKYAAFYFESLEDADKFVMEADDVLPHNLPEVLAHAKGYFLCAGAIVKKQGIFNVEEGTCSFTVTLPSREYLFIAESEVEAAQWCVAFREASAPDAFEREHARSHSRQESLTDLDIRARPPSYAPPQHLQTFPDRDYL